jgi:uncharacterized protein YndB with AHSA1/START domain
MKTFRYLVGAALLALSALILIGLSLPGEWSTEEKVMVQGGIDEVFPLIGNLRNWESWTIWFEHDPEMKVEWHGPETGVGSGYDWAGTDAVGSGTVRVVSFEPGSRIVFRLSMDDNRFVAMGTLKVLPHGPATTGITWEMQGELGYDPFARFNRSMLESAVQGTLRESLEKLIELCEQP